MKHKQAGFTHLFIIILFIAVILFVGMAAKIVLDKKTTISSGGYKWSTMDKGPYNDEVMFVTSSDPYNWTRTGEQLAEHASVPDVLVKDNQLFVYFVDVSTDGKPEQIGYRTSNDNGQSWSEKKFATFEGTGDMVPVDPAPILLDDGRVRMYYYDIGRAGTKQKTHTIYSAISNDGIHFTQEEGSRLSYDDIYDPDVIKLQDGTWVMYVGTGDQKVLYATSSDGLHFTYGGISYEGGAIPNVLFHEDTYILYTGGIQIATSGDGKTFTKTTYGYNAGGITADPGVIKLSDSLYFMAYKTSNKTPEGQPVQSPGAQPTQPQTQSPTAPTSNSTRELAPLDPSLPQGPAQ